MAEERIWIETFDSFPCDDCEYESECQITCENRRMYDDGMTRQEAIEKIDYVLQDFGIRKNDLEIAEAALNALLGDK